jgi:hypothetical protein
VRNEVLYRVKEERNVLYTIKRRKANWIGHILSRRIKGVKKKKGVYRKGQSYT